MGVLAFRLFSLLSMILFELILASYINASIDEPVIDHLHFLFLATHCYGYFLYIPFVVYVFFLATVLCIKFSNHWICMSILENANYLPGTGELDPESDDSGRVELRMFNA